MVGQGEPITVRSYLPQMLKDIVRITAASSCDRVSIGELTDRGQDSWMRAANVPRRLGSLGANESLRTRSSAYGQLPIGGASWRSLAPWRTWICSMRLSSRGVLTAESSCVTFLADGSAPPVAAPTSPTSTGSSHPLHFVDQASTAGDRRSPESANAGLRAANREELAPLSVGSRLQSHHAVLWGTTE